MKVILLNVNDEKVEIIDIEPKLEAYYKALDCDCIDIVERKIGKKWFDIVCDDEGLLKERPKISAINDMGEVMLVGNLMFCKHDDEGDTVGLTDEEITHIQKYIQKISTTAFPKGYMMLTQCEY